MKAACLIRSQPQYRRDAFIAGLEAAGYTITSNASNPTPDDALVIWNRYGQNDQLAKRYEAAGAAVYVVENGYLGRDWRDEHWYSISLNRHNGGGIWPRGGSERWDSWSVPLKPWRKDGRHVLVLLQRGIGVAPVAQPGDWRQRVERTLQTDRPIKWRGHPGEKHPHGTLYDDLADAYCCVTWASGAALKALLQGVPVFYGFPDWIGKDAASLFTGDISEPFRGDRLGMFRRMAWAQWSLPEISAGEPFRRLRTCRGSRLATSRDCVN